MASLTLTLCTFPNLPSQNQIISFVSLAPLLSRIHRNPHSLVTASRHRTTLDQTTMSVASPPPLPSLRRDKSEKQFSDHEMNAGKGEMLTTNFEQEIGSSNKGVVATSRYLSSGVKCFGVDLSPDNFAVAMVYFVQGVLGLARLAVNFYLKDDLHLDPAETAVISGFSALPWLIKPLYGFISDSLPLFGYRRRSYLVLSGLLGAFSWTLMATFVDNKYSAAFSILLGSLSVAFSDVVKETKAKAIP